MEEQVILVDEFDSPLGFMEKMKAHRMPTLHRAFSIFIFNQQGEMLLQKRASNKYHSPGLWTNACCSHPRPGEDVASAAARRLEEELGFTTKLEKIFEFVYQASFNNGLHEYEFDHVFFGEYDEEINPDTNEVSDFCYKSIEDIELLLRSEPELFTAWFAIAFPRVITWVKGNNGVTRLV